jgi:hypothetical protein
MADYSHSSTELTILAPNIFKMKPSEGAEIKVEDIRELRIKCLELSKGGSFAILLDATGIFTIKDDARALLASTEFTDKRIAAAFVTPGLANRIVGNFFIRFNKPASATKLFNDEASAFEWLKQIMAAK